MTDEPMLVRLIASAIGLALGAAPWFSRGIPARWQRGVPMSRVSQVMISVFGALFALTPWIEGLLCVMATALVLVGLSSLVDGGRYRRRMARKLHQSASIQPGIFDAPPPELESGGLPAGESFRVFDLDTGEEVGRLGRDQLLFLIERHREWELGDNDFFILYETLAVLEEAGAPSELLDFVSKALGGRDSVELRWVLVEPVRSSRDR